MVNPKSVVIAGLTRGYENVEKYQDLIARNKSINKCCNSNFDNILFHEGNISVAHQEYILSFTPDLKKNQVFISPYFRKFDVQDVTLGMSELLKKFAIDNNIELKNKLEESQESVKCPYTNCMVIDCEYFRNNHTFRKFQKKVDESSCIYSNRWGDLPLWGLVLWYFEDAQRYEEVITISYHHRSHGMSINPSSSEAIVN